MRLKEVSTWRVVFALVQLEVVVALVAAFACHKGWIPGGALATILAGLVGTSRIPAAVRVVRGLPPEPAARQDGSRGVEVVEEDAEEERRRRSKNDDDDPPSSSLPSQKTRRAIIITSTFLTFFLGLRAWKSMLERRQA